MIRMDYLRRLQFPSVGVLVALMLGMGCHHSGNRDVMSYPVPKELDKVTMPEHILEPPDIVSIDAIRLVPKGIYRVEPLDGLYIVVKNGFPDEPLAGLYGVESDGTINLGPTYGGTLRVSGLTLTEVKEALEKHLRRDDLKLDKSQVAVSIGQSRGLQQIRGEHLVSPDGTVNLGNYGSVRVVGMTIPEAKRAIETHLSESIQNPEIILKILSYNSKVFYVIFDGGGVGQQVIKLPITGFDTVLDAISQLNGLSPASSTRHMWIARPSPQNCGEDQILPVDWNAITKRGKIDTNYQLLPGDRLFVQANRLVAFNNYLNLILAPAERLFGFTLLGNSVIQSYGGLGGQNAGNGNGRGN